MTIDRDLETRSSKLSRRTVVASSGLRRANTTAREPVIFRFISVLVPSQGDLKFPATIGLWPRRFVFKVETRFTFFNKRN